ncbi:SulP family inorganic anion transporter [Microbacterium esteraromaticum]|uniref:SulP family inorganic anion transporter n=1 Tax=Microbacterium esteraromaticum TaxID=57043 RepID=UPI001A8EF5A1|nr:SulP family inorganic anion transporter [Microbacterium esteraromaticum]MBN8424623.1 SulP family inorganic anion transporter [Microbacterium esteraromaticum]
MSAWSPRTLLPSVGDYRDLPRTWRGDLLAGVTVGIVALPLALAFGVSSGAGAESGLVTAIIAGVVAAVFGGSHVQVSGPTGAMVVVLAPILAVHGAGALAAICLMAGLLVLAAGALRLGRTVGYIPWPVIEGFTLGIAVIIFLQQVPTATGAPPGESTNALIAAVQSLGALSWPKATWSLLLVAVVVIIMVISMRVHPRFPGSLLAIVAASLIAAVAGLPVDTIGELPAGLPSPTLPTIDVATTLALIGPAVAVAALAAIESLLSVRVAATLAETGPYDADRELVGQGLASIAAGLFGGMPATGAIARTAVNVRSGARTRMAAIVHALLLLAIASVGAAVVAHIPLAALAGVLMVTAVRMIAPATVRTVLRSTRADAAVFVVTAVVTVSVDLIYAVLIGLLAAGFFALRQLAKASGVHREELPAPSQPGDERIALFRLEGALFFGAAERMLERVAALDDIEVVVIRMAQMRMLDATGAQVITELIGSLERRGITVLIKGIPAEHLPLAERVGVLSSLRHQNHLFDDLDAAIAHARSHVSRS